MLLPCDFLNICMQLHCVAICALARASDTEQEIGDQQHRADQNAERVGRNGSVFQLANRAAQLARDAGRCR